MHTRIASQLSLDDFDRDGYVVMEDFLPVELWTGAMASLESLATVPPDEITGKLNKSLIGNDFFESIFVYEPLLDAVRSIIGDHFLFHHANGRFVYLVSGDTAKSWHHDFDSSRPWKPGRPMMVSALFYPGGVAPGEGCLSVLPGSHLREVERHAPSEHGVGFLDGEVEIIGEPGLLVLMNSALWHVKKPTRESCARYHFNISYCQSWDGWRERHEIRDPIREMGERSSDPRVAMLFGELDS